MLTQASRNSGGSGREANGDPNIFTSYEEVLEFLAREIAVVTPAPVTTTVVAPKTHTVVAPMETPAAPATTVTSPTRRTASMRYSAPIKTIVAAPAGTTYAA